MKVKRILLQSGIEVGNLLPIIKKLRKEFIIIIEDNELKILDNIDKSYVGVLNLYTEKIEDYPIMSCDSFET